MTEKAKSIRKKIFKIIIVLAVIGIVCLAAVIGINYYMKQKVSDSIITENAAAELTDADCIIVPGCLVWGTSPSPTLLNRLDKGIELYKSGAAPKLLMSGDHGRKDYDEVNAMKQYAIDKGIPSEDIFMDHAGFSTYETMYRAAAVFDAKRVIIVSQDSHIHRCVYDAQALGLEAYGVTAETSSYHNRIYDIREVAARCKDFVWTAIKPKPTYLGDVIPISGSGDLTNDKEFT